MSQLLNSKLSYCFFLVLCICFFLQKEYAQESTVQDTIKIISSDPDSESEDDEQAPVYNGKLMSLYRPVPADTLNTIKKDSRFYYKNYLDSLLRASKKVVKQKPDSSGFLKSLFELIIWVGAISIAGFLIYRLFFSNNSLFTRNRTTINGKTKLNENEITEDMDSLIQNAIRNGNYRLAVRYLYLQALRDLSGRGYIEITPAKTNFQYVSEVSKKHFANDFTSLTLKYEYVWYGEYPLDETLFHRIQTAFIAFNRNLGK